MIFLSLAIKKKKYEDVLALPSPKHKKPARGARFLRYISGVFIEHSLKVNKNFTYTLKPGLDKINPDEAAIYLMNHSSGIDLEILSRLLKERVYYLVGSHDGFVGRYFFLHDIYAGIPTKKNMLDLHLINDINYVAKKYKKPILIFPEASWCLCGVNAILPESLGGMLKYFKLPVYNIKTYGAYQRCPNYSNAFNRRKNNIRNVNVTAEAERLFSVEDLARLNPNEINDKLKEAYTYDHFRWQYENHIKVDEDFRARGLHHALYKCPHCNAEGQMESTGTTVRCKNCEKEYELTEYGQLKALGFEGRFEFPSDWYYWEEQCVKDDIQNNSYISKSKARIYVVKDYKAFYDIGEGYISQDRDGIKISYLDGNLMYEHFHKNSYSLYVDFYFFGDDGEFISVGNTDIQYYCFTNYEDFPSLKARFAAEEAYRQIKIERSKKC